MLHVCLQFHLLSRTLRCFSPQFDLERKSVSATACARAQRAPERKNCMFFAKVCMRGACGRPDLRKFAPRWPCGPWCNRLRKFAHLKKSYYPPMLSQAAVLVWSCVGHSSGAVRDIYRYQTGIWVSLILFGVVLVLVFGKWYSKSLIL